MAVNYKDLGLVNTREMFKRAVNGGYAIPAFNFNNLEQLQAIITASSELRSPVILQVSKGARNYANPILLRYMAEGAVGKVTSILQRMRQLSIQAYNFWRSNIIIKDFQNVCIRVILHGEFSVLENIRKGI